MHIIVPLDGSLLAERAIAPAALLARRATDPSTITLLCVNVHDIAQATLARVCQGEIVLFHVAPMRMSEAQQRQQEEVSYQYLDAVATRLERTGITVDRLLAQGDVADSISNSLRAKRADILAIATHGQGGPGPFGGYSTAESVLHHVTVPVLMVHPYLHGDAFSSVDAATTQ